MARPVPGLDLADLDDHRWSLAALVGRVVVLNFWATWCEPCRAEMPSLAALAARMRAEGVVVLAINYKEPPALIRQFVERLPFTAPVLLDADGDATFAWSPRVFPSTVLIGRDGRPTVSVLGELDWGGTVARELLEPLIAKAR